MEENEVVMEEKGGYAVERARRYKGILVQTNDLAHEHLVLATKEGGDAIQKMIRRLRDNGYDPMVPDRADHPKLKNSVIITFPRWDGISERERITSVLRQIVYLVKMGKEQFEDCLLLSSHPSDVTVVYNEAKSLGMQCEQLQSPVGPAVLIQ